LVFPITRDVGDHGDSGDRPLPPPIPIPDWRRVERHASQTIPDWRVLQCLGLDWRRVQRLWGCSWGLAKNQLLTTKYRFLLHSPPGGSRFYCKQKLCAIRPNGVRPVEPLCPPRFGAPIASLVRLAVLLSKIVDLTTFPLWSEFLNLPFVRPIVKRNRPLLVSQLRKISHLVMLSAARVPAKPGISASRSIPKICLLPGNFRGVLFHAICLESCCGQLTRSR
jgi:hypothetical protein